ncbi:DUF1462 family protein [Shouchella lonarensis]|nr:DUF1462 family protein [Shouchella lonarensis]
MKRISVTVYGANRPCPGCVQMPSSQETKTWLEAALWRKFPELPLVFRYVDIDSPSTDEDQMWAMKILNDEYIYPLVVLNGDVVAEGNPSLKVITEKIAALSL